MRSFTSNSNDRLPYFDWRKTYLCAGTAVIAFITLWNIVWVSLGVPLEPRDNYELWSYHRRRASKIGDRAIVFTGSSRIKAGIDLDEVRRLTGKEPIQLAIAGKSPLRILENLAKDEAFTGTVIAEITESTLYSQFDHHGDDWISSFEKNDYGRDYIFPMKSFVESHIASPNLGDTTSEALSAFLSGKVFDRYFLDERIALRPPTTTFDRSSQGYADDTTSEQIEQKRRFSLGLLREAVGEGPPEKVKFMEAARLIEAYTRRIQDRGGRVVLVNFPLNGEVKDLSEQYFPKAEFWDELAAHSSAQAIHYADHPTLAAIETLDGTHFSGRNATLFTRALFKIIAAAGASPPSGLR